MSETFHLSLKYTKFFFATGIGNQSNWKLQFSHTLRYLILRQKFILHVQGGESSIRWERSP